MFAFYAAIAVFPALADEVRCNPSTVVIRSLLHERKRAAQQVKKTADHC
jgi:hypothetical protein